MRGKFIVFEGIDGAGKTTQIRILADRMTKEGRKVHLTQEPTSSVTGGLLRDALSGNAKRTTTELAALFLADRIFHNVSPVDGIRKMLMDGYDVICDRYYYSSMAYQGSATDEKWVNDMNLNCPDILKPDLCIFLDLTPEQALKRIESNRSTTEIFETEDYLKKTRNQFFRVFGQLKDENIQNISAYDTIDKVADAVWFACRNIL